MENPLPSRSELNVITRRYHKIDSLLSFQQLALSLIGWTCFYVGGLFLIEKHSLWAAACIVGSAVFTLRLFMIQHDCGHGTLFKSHRVSEWAGFFLGVLTMTPYHCWYRCHALHHARSGNLAQRGIGDICTLTVREYLSLPGWQKMAYRLYRHPLILFAIGPFLLFCLRQRLTYYLPVNWRKERYSVHATNAFLLAIAALVMVVGRIAPVSFFVFHTATMALASSMGVWLFYVQHQFPDAYWEQQDHYNTVKAALQGSSYYHLPVWLRWVTVNIGFHHIHHLDPRIPNYRLADCYQENVEFQLSPRIDLRTSLSCMRLKLWDENRRSLVGFTAAVRSGADT